MSPETAIEALVYQRTWTSRCRTVYMYTQVHVSVSMQTFQASIAAHARMGSTRILALRFALLKYTLYR